MNEQVKKDGELLFYARAGMTEKVLEALENGARIDADCGDRLCPTALHAAAYGGHAETVEVLLKAGAQPDLRNAEGSTPLYCAVFNVATTRHPDPRRQMRAMEQLLRHGADPELGTIDDFHPLHCAALIGETGMVELLLDYGADINATDSDGNTALHHAMSRIQLDTIRALVERKADPLQENKWGESAQDRARLYQLDEALDLFEQKCTGVQTRFAFKQVPEKENAPSTPQAQLQKFKI